MSFISRLHASLRLSRIVREDASGMPPSDVRKQYPRFESLALPAPRPIDTALSEALRRRRSFSTSVSDRALGPEEWSNLLGNSLSVEEGARRRAYPSGGARYPIETYAIGTVLDASVREIAHYDPQRHAFERLWTIPASAPMKRIFRGTVTPLSETALVFTAIWERSESKYGRFAYDLALLEAGHMAQNVLLAATALGIGARPVAGFDDTTMETILDLDSEREQAIYAVMLTAGAHSHEETIEE